jgi:hypothetical protein
LIDSHEIHHGDNIIDAIIFNLVTRIITKWRTFKLMRWMQNLHQSTW